MILWTTSGIVLPEAHATLALMENTSLFAHYLKTVFKICTSISAGKNG